MSLRDTMDKAVADLAAAHETNRTTYRDLRAKREELDAQVLKAKDAASVSANELGAAKKALDELNRNTPAIEGSGSVGG